MESRRSCSFATLRSAVVAGLLVVGLLGPTVFYADGSELRMTPTVRAIQSAKPSIVNIRGEKMLTETGQYGQSDPSRRVNGMGTGVVIDSRGYIVTNHHVVKGVREILVTSVDGREFVARLIAHDPITDLAIIKIDPDDPMPSITLGNSADLMLGETVIAVGNAYGYENSVTQGIVSQLHRAVQVSDAQFYEDLIQTDASINPGNSGGPLLNIDGEMIGLNVAVRAGAQGIGFAIPIDKVLDVVTKLIDRETGSRSRHGIGFDATAGDLGGLVVGSVETGSPADKAGLKTGDTIVSIDDSDVERRLDFHRSVLGRENGSPLHLTVERDGERIELDVALSSPRKTSTSWGDLSWEVLGMDLDPIPTETFRRKFRTRYRGGMTVQRVRSGSPADEQGIQPGDVLVGMHIWETLTMKNVAYIMNRSDFDEFSPIKFYILRNNDVLYGHLPISMASTQRR